MADNEKSERSYKDTLNLPQTDFPIRPNAAVDDPALVARWEQEKLYDKAFSLHQGAEKYVLHDGPPYANGNIHVGHAYNKILKDIVTKFARMKGMQVPVTPGWDCHGLPIELKVTQENPGLSGAALKKACRDYAQRWIDIQRQEFKRLGVVMDWDHPYTTMSFEYEAAIIRAFGVFVNKGYIERKNKTVPWCPSDQTVLAAAEIEYQERKDPSLYVLFPVEENAVSALWPELRDKEVSFVLWTTTPWTLPLNRAVLIKPHTDYVVVKSNDDRYLILGAALIDKVRALVQQELPVVHTFSAEYLLATKPFAHHPFIPDLKVPVIASGTVQLNEGTALVHCAPGCGPEDYEVGVEHALEIFSPISPDGKYTEGIKPEALLGMAVSDGQIWVIKELAAQKKLFYKTSLRHPYPHCWRCRNGLIFRATKQWFCDLSRDNLKQKSVDAIDTVTMIPAASANRFKATLEGRLEWCLSRQRVWGVPIPALVCDACDFTFITAELIEQVAVGVQQQGIEYWDTVTVEQLMPKGATCTQCKKGTFAKERDILDVWFESGVSHYAVLRENPALAFPADMYLEGKDQHRAWFQSSLLTAEVLEGKPPFKRIITHGFTVDEQGKKMSKSLGNVVTPEQMMAQLGTDGLRLWAASIDYADDAVISPALTENIKEVYRKIRNTMRFLLSNLYDFDSSRDVVALDALLPIDRYGLHELIFINAKIRDAYERYDFTDVVHSLGDYCSSGLSALYLDIIKDRLYVEKADGIKRRSAQTVCWYILDTMTHLMAPILSFTAEQLSDHYQNDKKRSIHLQEFADLMLLWEQLNAADKRAQKDISFQTKAFKHITETMHEQQYMQTWQQLLQLRSAVLKAIEKIREQGIVKHSLEVKLTLNLDPEALQGKELLMPFFNALDNQSSQNVKAFFEEFFIVSQVVLDNDHDGLQSSEYPGLSLFVEHAQGNKCPRCWRWDTTNNPDHLCSRCEKIVQ